MRVKLFQNKTLEEERIDIHFVEMSPIIEKVIELTENGLQTSNLAGKSEKGEIVFFKVEDVYYFESVDKRTYAYLENCVYEVKERLVDIEAQQSQMGFIRINKSNVVNILHIHSIIPEVNMRVRAVLENDEYLFINRSYKKQFVAYLRERKRSL